MNDYEPVSAPPSFWRKAWDNLWIILSISLLNYALAIAYALLAFQKEEPALISILTGSLLCFCLSESHLLIYGVSNLSLIFFKMFTFRDSREMSVSIGLAGAILLVAAKPLQRLGAVFNFLPPKLHMGIVAGICFTVFAEFFPLALSNIESFYEQKSLIYSPVEAATRLVASANWIGVLLTAITILLILLSRNQLKHYPLVLFLAIFGIVSNLFLHLPTLGQLSGQESFSYRLQDFVVLPTLTQCLHLLPASLALAFILALEQLLYAEEIRQRKRRADHKHRLLSVEIDETDLVGSREMLILGLANLVSGALGGLPLSISLFSSLQHFFQKEKLQYRGTKVVGLLQGCLGLVYSLRWLFPLLPTWTLFAIILIPFAYYFFHMRRLFPDQGRFIFVIAFLTLATHPAFALIVGAFYTIYELTSLLESYPAEISFSSACDQSLLPDVRRSQAFNSMVQRQSGLRDRIKVIDEDMPPEEVTNFAIYRFTGVVSYLNFHKHEEQIRQMVKLNSGRDRTFHVVFSFRYVQNIDQYALADFGSLVGKIRGRTSVQVLVTGLHTNIIKCFCNDPYFIQVIEEENIIYKMMGKDFVQTQHSFTS